MTRRQTGFICLWLFGIGLASLGWSEIPDQPWHVTIAVAGGNVLSGIAIAKAWL